MGQIFFASAYDIEAKRCCIIDADKFHANCYSYSGAVAVMHYLLRQQPYHIMWGGQNVLIDDDLHEITEHDTLIGISTYGCIEPMELNHSNPEKQSYDRKVKLINDTNREWHYFEAWDEAIVYFDLLYSHMVLYDGYLINHTKKQAVDLNHYLNRSKITNRYGHDTLIDALPVLTETGGGTLMALFDGATADTTEGLAQTWCGDLLQIVDELPLDYSCIECCFVKMWERAEHYYYKYGCDADGFVLCDAQQHRFEGVPFTVFGERGCIRNIKAEIIEDKIKFSTKAKEELLSALF
jgi:hypothetical protein